MELPYLETAGKSFEQRSPNSADSFARRNLVLTRWLRLLGLDYMPRYTGPPKKLLFWTNHDLSVISRSFPPVFGRPPPWRKHQSTEGGTIRTKPDTSVGYPPPLEIPTAECEPNRSASSLRWSEVSCIPPKARMATLRWDLSFGGDLMHGSLNKSRSLPFPL